MDRHGSRGTSSKASPTADSGAPGVDPGEFAEYLRAERERRRLTLDQIADETKIASRHLAALERGDVRNWPGGMYRRAMMRAYAESIGVDREYALKQFEQAFDAPPSRVEAPTPAPPVSVEFRRWRPSRKQLLASAASILTLAAVLITWNLAGTLTSADADVPRTAVAEPDVAPPVRPRASAPAVITAGSRSAVTRASALETVATTGSTEPRVLATEGNLVVTSQPAGARVTVNGIGWGETPVTIRHLEFGSKRVRLTMQGYVSQERVVGLGPEQPHGNVRFTLRER